MIYLIIGSVILYNKLRRVILNICDMAGFEIRGPLVLIDKKTKKVWRR